MHERFATLTLVGVAMALAGCGAPLVGEGGHCGSPADCESGLTCYEGWCTGDGSAAIGDACAGTVDCTPGSICWSNTCVGVGALRFSLAWTVDTDFDLHVVTPDGTELSYQNRSAEGGTLDVDDCVGGSCKDPNGTHVENIVFPSAAPSGTYSYWVNNYGCTASGSFSIDVYEGPNHVDSNGGTLPAQCIDSTHFTFAN